MQASSDSPFEGLAAGLQSTNWCRKHKEKEANNGGQDENWTPKDLAA